MLSVPMHLTRLCSSTSGMSASSAHAHTHLIVTFAHWLDLLTLPCLCKLWTLETVHVQTQKACFDM